MPLNGLRNLAAIAAFAIALSPILQAAPQSFDQTLQPSKDFGFVVMTNVGGPKADAAFNQLAPELYKRFMATVGEGRR